jgi:hypothetical protein
MEKASSVWLLRRNNQKCCNLYEKIDHYYAAVAAALGASAPAQTVKPRNGGHGIAAIFHKGEQPYWTGPLSI